MSRLSRNVKVTARRGIVSKTLNVVAGIATAVASILGGIPIIGAAVVSGFGYYKTDEIVQIINGTADQISEEANKIIADVTDQATQVITSQLAPSVDNLTKEQFESLKPDIETSIASTLKEAGLPDSTCTSASQQIVAAIGQEFNSSSSVAISQIQNTITSAIKDNNTLVAEINDTIHTASGQLVEMLFGKKDPESKKYDPAKMKIWHIVFIVTTTVVSTLVLGWLAYGIARIVEKSVRSSDVIEAKQILKDTD